MTTVSDLQATVTLAGVSQSGHIRSVKRTGNLIKVGQDFTVELDLTASGLAVGQSCLITEQGTLVLTGRVNEIAFRRDPEPGWTVSGRDEFWRATDYYVDDKDLQATGETVTYWIDYLCNLCGLSYVISSSGGTETVGTVDTPVPLGLMNVVDSLRQLAGGGGWTMRMTAAGVLEFISLPDSGAADEIVTVLHQGNHTVADEQVRTVAKVWGYEAGNDGGLVYKASSPVPGIIPDRIMVVSSPNITTLARAQTLANLLLTHFAHLDQIGDAVLPLGDPTRLVGQIKQMTIEPGQPQRSILTDLESTVDLSGYNQSISIGRKNFWLPTYPPGNIPAEWEKQSVPGESYDCCVFNGYVYACGQAYFNDDITKRQVWRIEKRSLIDGSLAWAVSEDLCTSNPSSLAPSQAVVAYGIRVTLDGVFVCGQYYPNGLSGNFFARWEKRAVSDGALQVSVNNGTATSSWADLVVTDTAVILTDSGLRRLWSYDFTGAAGFTTTVQTSDAVPLQAQASSLDLDGTVILAGGSYNTAPFTPRRWLAHYGLGGGLAYDIKQSSAETSGFGALAASIDKLTGHDFVIGIGSGTLGGIWGYNGVSLIFKNPNPNDGILSNLEANGAYVWAAFGDLHWYDKSSGSEISSRALSGGRLRGVALVSDYNMRAISGEQSSKFFMGMWS